MELPGIEPLNPSRLSDEVAERIRNLIITENIAEGSRLPPERELTEQFGASRPTVSQALRTLSLMGLVEIRRGSGAYVVRRPESMVTASVNLMLDLDETSVVGLAQLRYWLETIGVREAAIRLPSLSDLTVAELRHALHRLEQATGDASERIAADTVFHATIVKAAGNPYLTRVYESVHTAVLTYEFKQWVQRATVPDWLRDSGHKAQMALHKPILDAVLAQDPDGAQKAVEHHHEAMLEHLKAAIAEPKAQQWRSH
ncbi:FadR/GntR family transcriptional regulator [Nocardia sp. NPDC051911]|uniref:FadR/GntR family transcriptional regulator n=1 Tax=Nocardia sp. NPDC051911 TaxID=3154648 RepID=UPI003430D2F7